MHTHNVWCRAPWDVAHTLEVLLGDVEGDVEEESEESAQELEDVESPGGAENPASATELEDVATVSWQRFQDPVTGRIWWWADAAPDRWFFDDSGCQQ